MLKDQFNLLIADQVATNLKYIKHNTFANANKPGRWLAYQIRKRQKARLISKVLVKDREIHQQEMIKKAFTEFYSHLYSSEIISSEDIDKYLQSSSIYKLTLEQQKLMNEEITTDEILTAIDTSGGRRPRRTQQ